MDGFVHPYLPAPERASGETPACRRGQGKEETFTPSGKHGLIMHMALEQDFWDIPQTLPLRNLQRDTACLQIRLRLPAIGQFVVEEGAAEEFALLQQCCTFVLLPRRCRVGCGRPTRYYRFRTRRHRMMALQETPGNIWIEVPDQHRRVAGGIETMAPSTFRVNGKRLLMIATVDRAVGTDAFASHHIVAQITF